MSFKAKVNRVIAQEIVDHQDNSFGIELEAIIAQYNEALKKTNTTEYTLNYVIELEKSIFNRLGIRVRLDADYTLYSVDNIAATASSSPHDMKTSILANEWRRRFYENKVLFLESKERHGKSGFIDLHKAKVGGLFSEYNHRLYVQIPTLLLHFQLSPREVVAIILHELGHIFTAYEYMSRLETTNQVIANVIKALKGKDVSKQATYIYHELEDINANVTEEDVDKILSDNKVIAGTMLFSKTVGYIQSQLKDSYYDITASEQLADSFAARFGYGREVIVGLNKVFGPGKVVTESMDTFRVISKLILSIGIAIAAFVGGGLFGGLTAVSIASLVTMGAIEGARTDFNLTDYDDTRTRYKRVRNEYVDKIKNLKLDSGELKAILKDIEEMDKIVDQCSQYKTIYNRIASFLYTDARQAEQSIAEQKLLEELAFNDLFLKSAQLKAIE